MTNSTMTCEAFDQALPEYLEGTLDGSLRPAVEGHLRECVRCTGLVKDLRGIESEAAKLPDLVPSRDLWQGIEARIAAPVIPFAARPERTRRFAPAWIGIAAAALIVTTAGITYMLTARSLRTDQPAVASIGPAVSTQSGVAGSTNQQIAGSTNQPIEGSAASTDQQPAQAQNSSPRATVRNSGGGQASGLSLVSTQHPEAVYDKEIAMLQRIVSDRKTQLDSTTIAIIERNLLIIDKAIQQSKAALATDPASRLLSEQLTRALDKKVELLRTAAMLPANT